MMTRTDRIEHIKRIIELNDAKELTDMKIVELATQTKRDENMTSEILYLELLDVEANDWAKRVSVQESKTLMDEFRTELYRFIERHNIEITENEHLIIDALAFTIISNDDVTYLINSFFVGRESVEWYYDLYWSAINTIKTLLADAGYDDCMVDYIEDWQGRLSRGCADIMARAIKHLKQDSAKLIWCSDDLFSMKELESLSLKGGK